MGMHGTATGTRTLRRRDGGDRRRRGRPGHRAGQPGFPPWGREL